MNSNTTKLIRTVLGLIGIILVIDVLYTNILSTLIAISISSMILAYLLISKIIFCHQEINRIIHNNKKLWINNKTKIDWRSLISAFLLFIVHSKLEGSAKYMFLIQGIMFLFVFIYNTINSFGKKRQIISIDSNCLTSITDNIEEIDLSKFVLLEKTEKFISFKNRWRTIKIIESDFSEPRDLLYEIESKLKLTLG